MMEVSDNIFGGKMVDNDDLVLIFHGLELPNSNSNIISKICQRLSWIFWFGIP